MATITQKGIVYCRVSSQEQVQGTSLDNQEKACLDYAEKKGIQIDQIFIEKGESATAANRTEFLKALDYCRQNKGKISAFIVWKIDRFARNTTDHFAVRAKLMKYGTTLHSVTEAISQDPQGKLMETLLAGFAEFENEVRKQRCTAGMQGRLRDGIWCWTPPIGYINSKKSSDRRKLRPDEPDPERFSLIQKALKTYLTGNYTILALTDLINKWGLRTRTGKPMRFQLVEQILRDKFYAGIIVDPWTGEEYQGQHEPMITSEEYYRIQFIKNKFSRVKNIPYLALHPDFPLRRFMRCVCKEKLTGSWRKGRNKKYAYYSCRNKNCPHYIQGIPKQDLEEKFVELLYKITPREKTRRLFETAVINFLERKYVTSRSERKDYEHKLKQLETRKEKLIQMRINNEISREEFLASKEKVEIQIVGIHISKNEAQSEELDLKSDIIYLRQFLGTPARLWQDMNNPKQKQQFQKVVFPQGLVYDRSNGKFNTAKLSCIFKLLEEFPDNNSGLVAEVGRLWHQIVLEIKEIVNLTKNFSYEKESSYENLAA